MDKKQKLILEITELKKDIKCTEEIIEDFQKEIKDCKKLVKYNTEVLEGYQNNLKLKNKSLRELKK